MSGKAEDAGAENMQSENMRQDDMRAENAGLESGAAAKLTCGVSVAGVTAACGGSNAKPGAENARAESNAGAKNMAAKNAAAANAAAESNAGAGEDAESAAGPAARPDSVSGVSGRSPRLRVHGFTQPWQTRKFGDTVTIERGGSPRPIDKFITDDENGLNWIKIGDAPEFGNYITHTSEKIIPEGLSKTRQVHPGDLILSNSMSFGKPYIMGINGCIHDGWLLIRDEEENYDLKFLCVLLGTESMLNQYKAMAAGSTVNNLNKQLVGGTVVSYPSVGEQRQIGMFFSGLDRIISVQERKTEALRQAKKYYLQNMFA